MPIPLTDGIIHQSLRFGNNDFSAGTCFFCKKGYDIGEKIYAAFHSRRKEGFYMTKIDIISGFLGAGKTTLIKKLLKEAYPNEKLVLIENEFGEISIDGGFLKDSGVQVSEMWLMPYFSTIFSLCVPLPEPGAPKITMFNICLVII